MKYKQIAKTTELIAGVEPATQVATVVAFADPTDENGAPRAIAESDLEFIRAAVAAAAEHVGIITHTIAAFGRFAPVELGDGEVARAKCVVTIEKGTEI